MLDHLKQNIGPLETTIHNNNRHTNGSAAVRTNGQKY